MIARMKAMCDAWRRFLRRMAGRVAAFGEGAAV